MMQVKKEKRLKNSKNFSIEGFISTFVEAIHYRFIAGSFQYCLKNALEFCALVKKIVVHLFPFQISLYLLLYKASSLGPIMLFLCSNPPISFIAGPHPQKIHLIH